MMREDAERILAFQRAYDDAGRLLYPDETLIDVARLPVQTDSGEGLRRTDRVLLFARPDCAACGALLARLLARLDRLDGVDIFLTGVAAGNEGAIRTWAMDRGIRPEWVTTRRVSLNFEGGALARVAPKARRAARPDAPAGRVRHAIVGRRVVRRYLGSLVALAAILVASPPVLAASTVPEGYHRVAAAHGIPSELFYAVALAESGKHSEQLRTTRPWPWTLNIHGEGRYCPSRQAAVVAAQKALTLGRRSVDIGLMQVNWAYNATALRSVGAAIDRYHNLDVGAGILAECFRMRGDWWAAVGCYHAPSDTDRAARYRERVKRIWSRVTAIG